MSSSIRQTVLPFKLDLPAGMMRKDDQLTGLGGLPLMHELYHKMKLPAVIGQYVQVKEKRWMESELIESIIALSVACG